MNMFLGAITKRLKRLDVGSPFRWVGFLEHFLTFLPTQVVLLQNLVQCATADFAAEDSFDPTAYFLDAPVVPRKIMLVRRTFFDRCYELLCLGLTDKGWRPPVCR